eukprot:TRINITY_DN29122_c1_g1_i1.p1 TRINITY_DN29122_c1_g1~~TRINITY_DN29122_c1_g1_i1.p1  ORF type:complete len:320 (+),score=52.79 TRINITY_DN29122_c1_g1_i1:149-1108(+)
MGIGTSRLQRNSFISALAFGVGSAILLLLKQRNRQRYHLEDYTITHSAGKIAEHYDIDWKLLQQGSYNKVYKANPKSTQDLRAVRVISKTEVKNFERLNREVAIMKMMHHPNIIKLFETFDDDTNMYLVLEFCNSEELFDRLVNTGHFKEVEAAILMKQILGAVHYLHGNHICHRDLKPENFLLSDKGPVRMENRLKLIDFGLSCKFSKDCVLTTQAGTPYYVAPQVLNGRYNQICDLWSCGVIMYVLFCGYPPFYGETDVEVLTKVRLGNYSFNKNDWKDVSEDAKNLVRNLLKMNPQDRFTAEQALSNIWILEKVPR